MASHQDIPFTSSDPWLLHAVLMAAGDGAASLKDVVATGDAINHAIFTFEEMDGGMARLVAAGLLVIDAGEFRPTDRARKLYGEVNSSGSTLFGARDALRAYLEAPGWSNDYNPQQADPDWQAAAFSRDDLSKACAQYHREFKQAYRKMCEEDP